MRRQKIERKAEQREDSMRTVEQRMILIIELLNNTFLEAE